MPKKNRFIKSPDIRQLADQSPTHAYFAPGHFSVSLTISDGSGLGDTYTRVNYIYIILPGDINRDGDVDGEDLAALILAMNTSLGDADYNPDADLNNDGEVNQADMNIFVLYFGS